MGLFDFFAPKKEREKNTLKKFQGKITQKYGPPENRQKIIHQLGDMATSAAYSVLCLRFTIRADPGITDDEEKETCRQILVSAANDFEVPEKTGDAARDAQAADLARREAREVVLGPVRGFLEKQESGIAWGLRVMAALLKAEEVSGFVTALLDRLGKEYSRDPEKKVVLLTWLVEHHVDDPSAGEAITAAVLPLLEDFGDDVRIASAKVLSKQALSEKNREALIALLLRDKDNARVRGEVLQVLCDLQADVKGHRPSVEAVLVEPYYLDKESRVKKRG
jgi:hypothetical protein